MLLPIQPFIYIHTKKKTSLECQPLVSFSYVNAAQQVRTQINEMSYEHNGEPLKYDPFDREMAEGRLDVRKKIQTFTTDELRISTKTGRKVRIL